MDVRKDYFPDGKVKIAATYNKEGKPEGIWREYSEEGIVDKSYIFKNGIVIGEGVVTEKGERDGIWKEYFDDGKLKAEGRYNKDVRTGTWKFYHESGSVEQQGSYNKDGKPEGEWQWFYDNGELLRTENYYLGKLDGKMTEYDRDGNIITEGPYIEGREDGAWFYIMGKNKVEGMYADGMRNGIWKYFDLPDAMGEKPVLRFEGGFIEDNPHGKHVYYWENGKIKDEGEYVMGLKNGDWTYYNLDGTPFLVVTYKSGVEQKYDGIRITPEPTEE